MKTSKILTLLVLAVFAMSFSTALSQEKKTRRQIKKEYVDQQVQALFNQGSYYIFRASYRTGVMMSSKGGIDYYSNSSTDSGLIYGTNLRLEFVISDRPVKVFYDVKGKCKSDVLYMYTGQEGCYDRTYLVGYTKGKKMIQVYRVIGHSEGENVCFMGSFPLSLVYPMYDYPSRAFDEIDLYNTYGPKVLRVYNR